ncbi:MAG: hypothetical protein HYS22_01395 [Deltaproteobacteria bacterium]|nr:hypothetical protein [Deltaproteobacteria bacterium]
MKQNLLLVVFIFFTSNLLAVDRSGGPDNEPTVQEVQEAALRYTGSNPMELESLKKKARWSAAMPRLQFGYARELKDVISLSSKDSVQVSGGNVFIGPDENDLSKNFNSGTSVDVRAVWYLNELVFNKDLLDVGVEQRNWNRERSRIASEVAELYYARRRVQEETVNNVHGRWLKIAELTAQLDALTGGWFSQHLGRAQP